MLSQNSWTCLAVGYLTLYSFTAFSFWINAMAANIFFKFSSMLSMSSSENSGFKLFLYFMYAQVWQRDTHTCWLNLHVYRK